MAHRIEVMTQDSLDTSKKGIATRIPIKAFNIQDDSLTQQEIDTIASIVADPVVDRFTIDKPILTSLPENSVVIEQSPNPGVNDPEGEETRKVIQRTLGREIGPVSSARQHVYVGELNDVQYRILTKQLGNPVVNDFRRKNSKDWNPNIGIGFHFPDVDLPMPPAFSYDLTGDGLRITRETSDAELLRISSERYLSLNLEEMCAIRELFQDKEFIRERKKAGLDSMPTDADLEQIAQTWSEHCIHKKLNANWIYTSEDPNDKSNLPNITNSIFKSIIKEATMETAKKVNWLVSIFEDNAGVIKLNQEYNIAHKVETHNHPSGVDGFGGADTGSGGVFRDPASTGTFMDIVSSQYLFGTPHPNSYPDLPLDIQSPARTLETVIAGVEDYGNKMGISTMCGDLVIDLGYLKPFVGVGCVATAPREINGRKTHIKRLETDYVLLTLGGGVGKDGIHGATGSSDSLSAEAEKDKQVEQSVQLGKPIVEKEVFEVMRMLNQKGYIEASQDCGAGGWNSAVGELAGLLNDLESKRYEIRERFEQSNITEQTGTKERLHAVKEIINLEAIASPFNETLRDEVVSGDIFKRKGTGTGKGGVVMDLSDVVEKYKGLTGWEKLISEAQEREVIAVKPENVSTVLDFCEHYGVSAKRLGTFNDSGFYQVLDQSKTITFVPIEFMHRGLPQMTIKAHWTPCKNKEPEIPELEDLTETLHNLSARPNLQSYEWICTRYDHEVQGGSVIKPIIGKGRGRSSAIAYHPIITEKEVVVESLGINPNQGEIDAYEMGKNAVVDAIGKIIAAGGDLEDKLVCNGNTVCPKPEKDPLIAARVIRMLKGSADAEKALKMIRISGKDSTSMEREYKSTVTGENVLVKAKSTLLISAVAVIPDDRTITTADFKEAGDVVYVVGETRDELGASEFYAMNNHVGRNVPVSDLEEIRGRYSTIGLAVKTGMIHSAQYVHRGGLAMALQNSSIAGDLGVSIEIPTSLGRADKFLFSETTGRFLVSVSPEYSDRFEKMMKDHRRYTERIGSVSNDKSITANYNGKQVIKTDVNTLREKNKGDIKF
ncbi:MAG: AIR synthase-related protein [Nanoarchaeota archaeon]